MILHDWFDWSNSGVGVTGLALTVGAIWQATGAKNAAREAREAVHQRNAADSFAEIMRLAEQFTTWVECERWAEAVVQIREISLRLARDKGEFSRFLDSDADKLEEVESDCRKLAGLLHGGAFPLGSRAKRDLFNDSLAIAHEISGILGRIRARAEMEGK
ncbi:MAG TPA: hypothetical protein VME23_18900 [Terracidiphilus sp.]|nr:hypothetical protein [Terracidiphilus sp.]